MSFKEFLIELKNAFYKMIINAIGSTTFWLTILTFILVIFKVISWEALLVSLGIYGGKRIVQDSKLGL